MRIMKTRRGTSLRSLLAVLAAGTTFLVTLPAVSTPAADAEGTRESISFTLRSPLAGLRLLFVDDEPALRNGMEAFGAMRGFTVVVAADGAAALSAARTSGIDAVVCDLRMPGMTATHSTSSCVGNDRASPRARFSSRVMW